MVIILSSLKSNVSLTCDVLHNQRRVWQTHDDPTSKPCVKLNKDSLIPLTTLSTIHKHTPPPIEYLKRVVIQREHYHRVYNAVELAQDALQGTSSKDYLKREFKKKKNKETLVVKISILYIKDKYKNSRTTEYNSQKYYQLSRVLSNA